MAGESGDSQQETAVRFTAITTHISHSSPNNGLESDFRELSKNRSQEGVSRCILSEN